MARRKLRFTSHKRRFLRVLVLAALFTSIVIGSTATIAEARSRSGNGWGAGSSSDEVSGRVGKTRPAPKPAPGNKKKPASAARCTKTRPCRSASRPPGAGTSSDEAMRTVKLPVPAITANPYHSGLAGLESRFWAVVPPAVSFDLSADGISTHLDAKPASVTWRFGDDQTSVAPADSVALPDATHPVGGVSITFERAGRLTVVAVVDWIVTWTTSDGESGSVDGRQSSSQIVYPVAERRSVLVRR